jgi:hypothetical protein
MDLSLAKPYFKHGRQSKTNRQNQGRVISSEMGGTERTGENTTVLTPNVPRYDVRGRQGRARYDPIKRIKASTF